jgi:hypothetical protein
MNETEESKINSKFFKIWIGGKIMVLLLRKSGMADLEGMENWEFYIGDIKFEILGNQLNGNANLLVGYTVWNQGEGLDERSTCKNYNYTMILIYVTERDDPWIYGFQMLVCIRIVQSCHKHISRSYLRVFELAGLSWSLRTIFFVFCFLAVLAFELAFASQALYHLRHASSHHF